MDSNESTDVQNCGPSQVGPEREPASPRTTTQAVSQPSSQPIQNNAVDTTANSNEEPQTATQAISMPTSGQDHQTDNATRNSSSDNPSAPQAATGVGSSSQGTRRVLCTDPPPPYPGPPLNSTFAPPNNTFSSPDNRFSPARNLTADPVLVFNPYGPANHGFMIPVLPGQIQYPENYPNIGHVHRTSQAQLPSVITTVVSQPPNTQDPVRVHPTVIARQPLESDYLRLSFAMLVCCSLQANIPALFFILPAIFLSMKAHQHNERGRFRKARSYGYAALLCNVLAMVEYILIIVGACVIFVLLYVVQIL